MAREVISLSLPPEHAARLREEDNYSRKVKELVEDEYPELGK